MTRMSKPKLFIELAQPDEQGVSRWVNVAEFVGRYESLQLGNGFGWGRASSNFAQEYIIEVNKKLTPGNKIDAIRLNGLKENSVKLTQTIRKDIRDEILKRRCVILGTNKSSDLPVEVDHKDGRKNDPAVMNTSTQDIEDFQPLSKPANDAKRQFCKTCRESNRRFDAKLLGYPVSVTIGSLEYDESIKCQGCFWYDPIAFREKLKPCF